MNSFLYRAIGRLIRLLAPIMTDRLLIKIKFLYKKGYWFNEDNPQTFCEKIQWLKLHNQRQEFTKMVDKVDAKLFVASIIGEEYIIPTLGVWDHFDDIDFSQLPDGFILKCAHDSSKGVVVKDKTQMNIPAMKKRMEFFQNKTYYSENREYPYKNVRHRLIAEKFLVNGTDAELKDYKFYCFNGHAEYCQLIGNRSTCETIDFYDRNWIHQPFYGLNRKAQNAPIAHNAPDNYSKMFELADKLSTAINHPFVRIDLYNVNGKIYFGEITFFPTSGMGVFTPNEWDKKLGEMIKLPIHE